MAGVWSKNRGSVRAHYFEENSTTSICLRVTNHDPRFDMEDWNPYDERTCTVCREILIWRKLLEKEGKVPIAAHERPD